MRYNRYSKMEEANDGDKGGAGGGQQKQAPDHSQQIELLTKSVGLLAQGLEKMEGNQTMILETLSKVTNQSQQQVKDQVEKKFGEDVDLEQLDRKDFATLIMESTKAALKEEMKKLTGDIDTRVNDLAVRFESKTANEQIEKTAEKNADFWDWSNEIKQLLKENPTLSVVRAYSLAKTENPKKATELDVKYKPADKKKEHSFIGLTPTSSLSTRDSTVGKMSQKEAAEAAFDKVMGELGDVIENGNIRFA